LNGRAAGGKLAMSAAEETGLGDRLELRRVIEKRQILSPPIFGDKNLEWL